ncbi:hypothetical protein FA13DRAFT_1781833, partial [Coprinellus micaceus]
MQEGIRSISRREPSTMDAGRQGNVDGASRRCWSRVPKEWERNRVRQHSGGGAWRSSDDAVVGVPNDRSRVVRAKYGGVRRVENRASRRVSVDPVQGAEATLASGIRGSTRNTRIERINEQRMIERVGIDGRGGEAFRPSVTRIRIPRLYTRRENTHLNALPILQTPLEHLEDRVRLEVHHEVRAPREDAMKRRKGREGGNEIEGERWRKGEEEKGEEGRERKRDEGRNEGKEEQKSKGRNERVRRSIENAGRIIENVARKGEEREGWGDETKPGGTRGTKGNGRARGRRWYDTKGKNRKGEAGALRISSVTIREAALALEAQGPGGQADRRRASKG